MFPEHDLILHGGNVITLDGGSRLAGAVAASAGRISAVGTDEEVLAGRGRGTRVIDLDGRTVCPGFIDTHAHMDREGLKARGGYTLAGAALGGGDRRCGRERLRPDAEGRVGGLHAHGHAQAQLYQPARPARGRPVPDPPRPRRGLAGQPGLYPRPLGMVGPPPVRRRRQLGGPQAVRHRPRYARALQRRDTHRRGRRAERRVPRPLLRPGDRVHADAEGAPDHVRGPGGRLPAGRRRLRGGRNDQHLRGSRADAGDPGGLSPGP